MIRATLTAAMLMALTASGAAALSLPGSGPGGQEGVVVRVVDPAPGAKRAVTVQRRAPVIARRVSPPVSVKKFVAPSASRKFTPPLGRQEVHIATGGDEEAAAAIGER